MTYTLVPLKILYVVYLLYHNTVLEGVELDVVKENLFYNNIMFIFINTSLHSSSVLSMSNRFNKCARTPTYVIRQEDISW